mmetsp:Transcript_4191/g.12945  ORF Transcript_4191/g.12945 Transcript_4191/m.12945 type:complete len:204 (-) Transcript_4191:424-1035(-)
MYASPFGDDAFLVFILFASRSNSWASFSLNISPQLEGCSFKYSLTAFLSAMFGCNDSKEIEQPGCNGSATFFSLPYFSYCCFMYCSIADRSYEFPLGLTTGSRYISNESGQQNASGACFRSSFSFASLILSRNTLASSSFNGTNPGFFNVSSNLSYVIFLSFAFSQCSMYLLFASDLHTRSTCDSSNSLAKNKAFSNMSPPFI